MKNPQVQLTSILTALGKIVAQVEKMVADLETTKPAAKVPAPKAKAVPKKKAVPAIKKEGKVKEVAAEKTPEKTPDKSQTVLDTVYDVICKSRKGASIDRLREKTDLDARQLSNALYKLTKKGIVEARSRGVYFKKK
jgi:hypothetical protein